MVQPYSSEEEKMDIMEESEALPMDIMEVILSRLPVKSLLRFKCVKRAWFTLINDVRFSNNRLNGAIHKVILAWDGLVMLPSSESNSRDLAKPVKLLRDDESPKKFSEIIGSSNGLLCIIHGDENNITLLNPSTRKFKEISFPIKEYQRLCNVDVFYKNIYGFWYDKGAKNYKIFVLETLKLGAVNVIVYCLGAKSWRRVVHEDSGYRICEYCFACPGILVNGALHWLASKEDEILIIFAFDCIKYELYELLLPANVTFDYCSNYLTMLESRLCIISYTTTLVFGVWVMEDYGRGESWVKQYTIKKPEYVDHPLKWKLAAHLLLYRQKEETMRTLTSVKSLKIDSYVCTCLESLTSVDL